MAQSFNITGGPSKWDLMLGLFDNHSRNPREIEFSIVDPVSPGHGEPAVIKKIKVVINGVGRESGNGESWIFNGYWNLHDPSAPRNPKVNGYYSTLSRTGWLSLEA